MESRLSMVARFPSNGQFTCFVVAFTLPRLFSGTCLAYAPFLRHPSSGTTVHVFKAFVLMHRTDATTVGNRTFPLTWLYITHQNDTLPPLQLDLLDRSSSIRLPIHWATRETPPTRPTNPSNPGQHPSNPQEKRSLSILRMGETVRRSLLPQARHRNRSRHHRPPSRQTAHRQEKHALLRPSGILRGESDIFR